VREGGLRKFSEKTLYFHVVIKSVFNVQFGRGVPHAPGGFFLFLILNLGSGLAGSLGQKRKLNIRGGGVGGWIGVVSMLPAWLV